jgi:putative transposase
MMCRVLEVSASGYYRWRQHKECKRAERDRFLMVQIKQVYLSSRRTYGAPRVHAELRLGRGIRCAKKHVARLMRQMGLQGISKRKRYGCTRRAAGRPSFPDLVKRDFKADSPDRLWVADITQHHTAEGWYYLSVVMDAYSRMILGWSMADRADVRLVQDAIQMALMRRRPEAGVVHHSDHGSQYTSLAYMEQLKMAAMQGSMGSVGDAYDNALVESFFATLQTELLDKRRWPSRNELRRAIFDYIEVFYNRQRRHSRLLYLSPIEFELRQAVTKQAAND